MPDIKAYHYPEDAAPCFIIVDDSVPGGEVLEVVYYRDLDPNENPTEFAEQLVEEYYLK